MEAVSNKATDPSHEHEEAEDRPNKERYEFELDGIKFPKGHRTERDKRKSDKHGKENADKPIDDGPVEAPRHAKKLRTSRTCKPRVDKNPPNTPEVVVARPGNELQAQEAVDGGGLGTDRGVGVGTEEAAAMERAVQVEAKAEEPASKASEETAMDNQEPEASKQAKVEEKEPDTSLSLGGVSGSRAAAAAAPSNRGRSFQTISQAETFSNGITTSLSLSCSHLLGHNPSCSLTHTSQEQQEFSTATQPMPRELSQGSRGGKQQHYKPSSEGTSSMGLLKSSRKKKQHSTGDGISLREIVRGPVSLVAHKLSEMPARVLDNLKADAMDLLECRERREEFFQLQKLLEARIDVSTETLLQCNRVQLEILVSLKTGIQAFLEERPLQSSVLADVFMYLKCGNMHCQNQLPHDNCECQVCSQKKGFCNACMCVVCSKFDFDSNTCRWVGCDYCLHWCHTDCGIRKAFIRPGPTIRGAAGTSEMQFHCIACGHTSELFGFVKDVFTTCAKEWTKEVLARELDCIRRLFHGSNDTRGKQLCWKSDLLLKKLEANQEVGEVCSMMLRFFEGGDAVQHSESERRGEASLRCSDVHAAALERATRAYDRVLEEKRNDAADMQYERERKRTEIEELEMRIKQAEAEATMFQARANEAARQANGLQRILLAKRFKVEEEYNCKKLKLQIEEAEQRRKRKFEDLQLLQKGSDNFEIMRNLMVDLQGLLKTMDPKCTRQTTDAQRYSQSRMV